MKIVRVPFAFFSSLQRNFLALVLARICKDMDFLWIHNHTSTFRFYFCLLRCSFSLSCGFHCWLVHLWASYKVNKYKARVTSDFHWKSWLRRLLESNSKSMWWSAGGMVSISYACISHIVKGIKVPDVHLALACVCSNNYNQPTSSSSSSSLWRLMHTYIIRLNVKRDFN